MNNHSQYRHSQEGSNSDRRNASSQQNQLSPCPQGISESAMLAISAPYNFVPLSDWVHLPEWGKTVSHDRPFQDGVSGEIAYTIHANCPLLVGGKQKKAKSDAPGEVHPFCLPDGRFAIPGSSIKGMLRAVVEIASFGRMRMVDSQRPGLRDISGPFVKKSYTDRVRGRVKTGFLRQADGKNYIIPCRMIRLEHRTLENVLNVSKPIFKARANVKEKYDVWQKACSKNKFDSQIITFDIGSDDAINLFKGSIEGVPVFTGQISDSTRPKGKQRDFIFYEPNESEKREVDMNEWRDFLQIHGDENGKSDMSWHGYWREQYRGGRDVPVFYVDHGDRIHIGLAYMPKLAGDYTTLDMIEHASPEHCNMPGIEYGYDFSDLLFGCTGELQEDALRGRVSCETAIVTKNPQVQRQPSTILNGPKPTYFPNYLTQKTDIKGLRLLGEQYATYVETPESRDTTLRGFKRYPARPREKSQVQALTPEQKTNNNVQVVLHTLPPDTEFKGRIIFHNLKPQELGALLWAISLDGNSALHHGLGMGKAFGFGQIAIAIDAESSRIIPNDPLQAASSLHPELQKQYRQCFEEHMEQSATRSGGWRGSPQIANLLAMADPFAEEELPNGMELRHMMLMRCESNGRRENLNEFVLAKQARPRPFVLADYAKTTGWSERLQKQAQEVLKLAEERERKEEEQRKAETLAEATAGLPDDAATLVRLKMSGQWTDNGIFANSITEFLNSLVEPISLKAYELLSIEIDERIPRLLSNPEAKVGKKQKPAFKPTQISMAKLVLSKRPC